MATALDARVSYLEGQVEGHSENVKNIRNAVTSLEARMDRRFESVDRRFDAVDRRFDAVDRRLGALDDKMSRQFLWLVGIQVTTLVTIVGAVLAAVLTR